MKRPSKRTLAAVFAAGLLAGCAGMQVSGPCSGGGVVERR